MFFKTQAPIEPASFLHKICKDAQDKISVIACRYAKRLTPVTMIGKATESSIKELSEVVLGPHFHQDNNPWRKVCADKRYIQPHTATFSILPSRRVCETAATLLLTLPADARLTMANGTPPMRPQSRQGGARGVWPPAPASHLQLSNLQRRSWRSVRKAVS